LTGNRVAVLIYDYLLTFIYEVERFWPVWLKNLLLPRRFALDSEGDGSNRATTCFSWVSTLFFVNRYLTLFGHAPVMLETFWRVDDQEVRNKVSSDFHLFDMKLRAG
jgi:hypothetical protein